MNTKLRDTIGQRGEKITELALTNYAKFKKSLFLPAFLGDKWPAIDFYVELTGSKNQRPYFFVQTKSTSVKSALKASVLSVTANKDDITKLLEHPGPTYFFGVYEPTQRVFVKSIHQGISKKAVTRISLKNELTPENLIRLHDEVSNFWNFKNNKPSTSYFQ